MNAGAATPSAHTAAGAPPARLDVVFTSSASFLPHFSTALVSLLENSRAAVGRVFLVHDRAEAAALRVPCEFFREKYGLAIEPVAIDGDRFDRYVMPYHFTRATFYRFMLPEVLPAALERVLYLDCDLVVTGELSALAARGFAGGADGEWALLAVDHDPAFKPITDGRRRALGITGDQYFNAGVLLLNLALLRREGMTGRWLAYADARADRLLSADQDVLNATLEGRWGALEPVYNVMTPEPSSPAHRIIHFLTADKPWHLGNEHPYRGQYLRYRKLTPYPWRRPEVPPGRAAFLARRTLRRWLPAPLRAALRRLRGRGEPE